MREHPLLTVIVGATNTGKTTLIEKIIKDRKRALAITPHFEEWNNYELLDPRKKRFWKYTGVRKVQAYKDVIKDINRVGDYFKNGVIIFEEAKFYIKPRVEDAIEQILIARDQRKTDIIVASHGLTLIPPIFFSYVDVFIMFRTQDNLQKRKKDLIWYDELTELQKNVNKQAKIDAHYYDIFKTKQI